MLPLRNLVPSVRAIVTADTDTIRHVVQLVDCRPVKDSPQSTGSGASFPPCPRVFEPSHSYVSGNVIAVKVDVAVSVVPCVAAAPLAPLLNGAEHLFFNLAHDLQPL